MELPPLHEAKNRAWWLLERVNTALEAGDITEPDWYRQVQEVITPAYLAGDNPRSQSGNIGDDEHWACSRGLIADAIERNGTFLDVGCASGYLMETLTRWAEEKGIRLEPYGLDIAPELAELARKRLPEWADRIFVGNGLDWMPPFPFDYVRTGLEYGPPRRQSDLLRHLLKEVVVPGGRLIIGTYGEERDDLRTGPTEEERIAGWGFRIAGRTERQKKTDTRLFYRALWIDKE
jgi:SAM-dependent methyltransferase